jgi:hypothetical protein
MPRTKQTLQIDISAPLDAQPRFLTVPEAAAFLRRSTRALARWEALGLIRVTRPAGGNPLIEPCEIERLLADGATADAR